MYIIYHGLIQGVVKKIVNKNEWDKRKIAVGLCLPTQSKQGSSAYSEEDSVKKIKAFYRST